MKQHIMQYVLYYKVRTSPIAHWKAVIDFLFVIIEHFHYLLRLRRNKQKSVDVGVFRRRWVGLFKRKFQVQEAIIRQPVLVPER